MPKAYGVFAVFGRSYACGIRIAPLISVSSAFDMQYTRHLSAHLRCDYSRSTRIGMNRYSILFIAAMLPIASSAASAQNKQQPSLPQLLSQLTNANADDATVINALNQMGPLCDQSCVPAVSDMLRHIDAGVVKAACRTAIELADPHLAPALMDVVRNHPLDDVRVEALKALTRIGRTQDYELLFDNADYGHPDWTARQIIRSLPKATALSMLSHISKLAVEPSLVTSVVHAYRDYPDELFAALVTILFEGQSPQASTQILRALAMISQSLNDPELPEFQQIAFWISPDSAKESLDLIATIQANRSTTDAVRWLLAYGSLLSPVTMLDVIERIHGPNADLFLDALFINPDGELNYQNNIAPYPALVQSLIAKHSANAHIQKLAIEKLRDPSFTEISLNALHNAQTPQTLAIVTSYLGHHESAISMAAMRIAGNNPGYWPQLVSIIQSDKHGDNHGRTYSARWAAAMLATKYKADLPDTSVLLSEARECMQDPRRLHAEPALWLLSALHADVQIDLPTFKSLRPDMKISLLQQDASLNSDIIDAAIHDTNAAVAAHAMIYIGDHPETELPAEWTEQIIKFIQSDNLLLSLNAILATGKRQIQAATSLLQSRMNDKDPKIVYNAIWALQQLRSLPEMGILSTIYYRSDEGFLKQRLGFLTGLDENRKEDKQMYEIDTQTPLQSHVLYQALFEDRPTAASNIAIMRPDMAIQMVRTNLIGMFYTPGEIVNSE